MLLYVFFFFKQKTAYEMRISDWSSDVCSSDLFLQLHLDRLRGDEAARTHHQFRAAAGVVVAMDRDQLVDHLALARTHCRHVDAGRPRADAEQIGRASCRERVCQYV